MPSAVKAVSKMITTYAVPDLSTWNSHSNVLNESSSRRTSMTAPFGSPALLALAEEHALRPVDAMTHKRHPDTHGSPRSGLRTSDAMAEKFSRRSLSIVDTSPGALSHDLTSTKPGIQCDLRRALSLDYQNRFSKLDISAERASYTQGAPLAKRSPDRKKRDLSENLAHRLIRERNRNPSFYDVV